MSNLVIILFWIIQNESHISEYIHILCTNIGLDVLSESMESNEPLLRYKWGNEEWVQCKVFYLECKRRAFRNTYAMYDHKYAGSYFLWHQDNFHEEREKTFCMKWDDDDGVGYENSVLRCKAPRRVFYNITKIFSGRI